MKATEAHQLAITNNPSSLPGLVKLIGQEARRGNYSMTIGTVIDPFVKEALEQDGYKVEFGCLEATTTISWV